MWRDISQTQAADPTTIRVACVGDSITAGYLSSNASFAYPGRLQAQLDSKFGAGKYTVTNFGAGGATVQKGADSPYWNRSQYAAFVNGSSYDIVIMMLVRNKTSSPLLGFGIRELSVYQH
jgi:sialate O-acetylesterase